MEVNEFKFRKTKEGNLTENTPCPLCGGKIRRYVLSSGNATSIVVTTILLTASIILSTTGLFGALVGIPLVIIFWSIGGREIKFWKCDGCGWMRFELR